MKKRLFNLRTALLLTGAVAVLALGVVIASSGNSVVPAASPTAEGSPSILVTPFQPTLAQDQEGSLTQPVPAGREALSEFNLEEMAELGRFGRGWPAAAAYAPDGSRLAVGSSLGVEIYSTSDWEAQIVIPTDSPILAVLYSPDGKRLAAGRQDGEVIVYAAGTGEVLQRLISHSRPVHGLAFSGWQHAAEESSYLASGAEDGSVVVWDLASGMARYKFLNPLLGYWGYGIRSLAFSPDDAVLVTGGDQGYLSRWDLATGEELPRVQTQYGLLFAIAFSPDGGKLASACGDGTVQVWDFTGEEPLPLALLKGHAYGAWSVTWTADGQRLATSAGDGMVKLWDAQTATLLREKAVSFTKIDSLQYSPDNTRFAAVSIGERALILDAQSLAETQSFADHVSGLRSAAFFPSGDWAALGGENGVTYLWNLIRGNVVPLGNARPASKADFTAVFSPRGGTLAVADGLPGILRLYDLKTLSPRSDYRIPGVRAIAYSPDGEILAAGGSGELTLVQVESGESRVLQVSSRFTSLAFIPDTVGGTTYLAGGKEDGSVYLWNVENPAETVELSAGGNSPVWSLAASGSLLAAGDDRGDIRVWDVAAGNNVRTFSGYMSSIFALAVSPDGGLLCAGGIQGAIRIWSLRSGTLIRVVPAHNGWVNALVFSPDGRWLLSAGSDGAGEVWGIP
jgi:WD40 repeat protein